MPYQFALYLIGIDFSCQGLSFLRLLLKITCSCQWVGPLLKLCVPTNGCWFNGEDDNLLYPILGSISRQSLPTPGSVVGVSSLLKVWLGSTSNPW